MNFRNVTLGLFISAAVFAAAQAGIAGALGAGEVTNADGAKAGFAVNFMKRTMADGSVRVGGNAMFGQRVEGSRPTEVKMLRADVVNVDGTACHAEGRGGFSGVVNGERVRKEGRVIVDVVDNKRPRAEGTPDTYAVSFASTDGTLNFSFSGNVTRGDIKVGTRNN